MLLRLANAYVWYSIDAPFYFGMWLLAFQLNPVHHFFLRKAIEKIDKEDAWH